MRPEFSNHEEWQDLRNTWADQPEEDVTFVQIVDALIICIALIFAAVVIAVAGWTFLDVDIQTLAPTAAEVMAPDFDLERKLAEVMP